MSRLFVALAMLTALTRLAAADEWPSRAVKIVVPFGAGGSVDIVARMVADYLSGAFDQPFFVENRSGAGGIIGTQYVASAEPDGYTLSIQNVTSLILVPTNSAKAGYDALRSFTNIAYIAGAPVTLSVSPKLQINTTKELTDLVARLGRPATFGSIGTGSGGHLIGAAIGQSLGMDVEHVPYRTAPQAIADTIGAHITYLPFPTASTADLIREGKLTGLAVTSASRMPGLENVPTFKELGYPELVTSSWIGLVGPARMPDAITTRLNSEIAKMLANPAIRDKLNLLGMITEPMSLDQFATFVAAEAGHWRPLIEMTGVGR